jgi:hypothetical protein
MPALMLFSVSFTAGKTAERFFMLFLCLQKSCAYVFPSRHTHKIPSAFTQGRVNEHLHKYYKCVCKKKKSYVRCENHKNENALEKHDQKNSSRRNKNAAKKTRRRKKKKNDKTRREKQSGEREEEKLCNRPMILVVARADPLRI